MCPASRSVPLLLLAAALLAEDRPLGIRAEVTAVSRFVSHGFLVTDGPCLQTGVTVDAALPGLRFLVWQSVTADRDQASKDEIAFRTIYGRIFGSGPTAIDLHGYGTYVVKPQTPSATPAQAAEGLGFARTSQWKFNLGAGLPSLLNDGPVTGGVAVDWFHWAPDPPGVFAAGSVVEPSATLAIDLPESWRDLGLQPLIVRIWADYHTGAFGVEPGWSNVDAGLILPLAQGPTVTRLGFYGQRSLEESVAAEDAVWTSLGCAVTF